MATLERDLDDTPKLTQDLDDGFDIDFGFITGREGFKSEGYIPKDRSGKIIGNSGVTVATGVDLGQQDINALKTQGLTDELINKISPYVGKKLEEAERALNEKPLNLEGQELKQLDNAVHGANIKQYADYYEQKTGRPFNELPSEVQTVVGSVVSQYGPSLEKRTPRFNSYILNNDIEGAKKELRNFGDDFPTRRNKEADLLDKISALNPFAATTAEASEQEAVSEIPSPSKTQELLNSPIGEKVIALQQGFHKFLGQNISNKAAKVLSGGMSLEEADQLRDMTVEELKAIPEEAAKASKFFATEIGKGLARDVNGVKEFFQNPIAKLQDIVTPKSVEEYYGLYFLTPEERENRDAFFKLAGKAVKPLGRMIESVRATGGAALDKLSAEEIASQTVKGFLKPETIETLTSRIPFQKWEREGDGLLESVLRLTPRAVAEGIETYIIADLTFNLGGRITEAARTSAAEREITAAFNKLRTDPNLRKEFARWMENRLVTIPEQVGGGPFSRRIADDLDDLIDFGIDVVERDFRANPAAFERVKQNANIFKVYGMKLSDESGSLRFATEKQHLKSNAKAAALAKAPGSVTKDQLIKTLKNAGVAAEELEFMNLDGLFSGKEKVNKQELMDYMEENKVQVEEKTLVSGSSKNQTEDGIKLFMEEAADNKAIWNDIYSSPEDPSFDELTYDERMDHITVEDPESVGSYYRSLEEVKSSTKYQEYTLPGGDNYREVLLKLPKVPGVETRNITRPDGTVVENVPATTFNSTHWDEPNVLAHLRINDRVDAEGNKVLFVEELQSDWHLAGKKRGYNAPKEVVKSYKIEEANGEYFVKDQNDNMIGVSSTRSGAERIGEGAVTNEATSTSGVPNAPFKNTWHELGIKKAIEIAVREGYDKVAFINGQQTADRYDLSKQVDRIDVVGPTSNGDYVVEAKKGGFTVLNKTAAGKNGLEELIGKGPAQKALEGLEKKNIVKLEGQDLKVGGEWAFKFYDQILPKSTQKYIKQWGGKVENITFDPKAKEWAEAKAEGMTRKEFEAYINTRMEDYSTMTQQGFTITPQMKKEVSMIGQPMFGKRLAGGLKDKLKSERGMADFSKEETPEDIPQKPQEVSAMEESGVLSAPKKPETPTLTSQQTTPSTPEMGALLSNPAKSSYDNYTLNDEINKAKNKMNAPPKEPPDGYDSLNSWLGKFELPPETKLEAFRRAIEDYNIRLKVLNKEVEKAAGENLPEHLDLWAQKDMLPRKQGDLLRRIRNDKIELVKKAVLNNHSISDINQYLHALHAQERNAMMNRKRIEAGQPPMDGLSGMTDAEAQQILQSSPKEFEKYSKFAKEMNEETLLLQVESGLLSPEDADKIRNSYKNYVPLFRDVDDASLGIGIGSDIRGKEVKRAKGSFSRALSPLGNLFYQRERALIRALKNQIGNNIIKLTEEYPFTADIFKVSRQQFIPRFNSEGELQFLEPQFTLAPNVLGTKIDGKQYLITIEDPRLVDSLKNLNIARIPKFVESFRATLGIWSSFKTRWSLEFMFTNFERDLWEALVNLDVEKHQLGKEGAKGLRRAVVRDLFRSQRQIFGYLRGKDDPVIDEFFKLGGDTGHFWLENAAQAEKSLLKLEKEIANVGMEKVLNPIRSAGQLIDDLNSMVELGVRFSAYKQLVKRGFTKPRAVQAASDLTINFSRQGEWSPFLKSFYGFINPAIQGASKVIRTTTAPGAAARVSKSLLSLVALGFFTRFVSSMIDEEGDEQINPWAKNNKIVFALGDNKQLTLWSLPYGYNTFYAMGSNLAEVMMERKTIEEAGVSLIETAANSFSPFGTRLNDFLPTLAQPIFDINSNEAWHGGNVHPPDNPFDRTPKPRHEVYFRNTAQSYIVSVELMNKLSGGILDVRPNDMEYLFDQYFGGPFEFALQTVESGARAANGEFNPNETPFVRKVFRENNPSSWSYSVIYDTLEKSGRKEISDLERKRFFRAVNEGMIEGIFDMERGEKYTQDFLKSIHGIEGGITSPITINILKSMPAQDREMLIGTYANSTQRRLRQMVGIGQRKLEEDL